MRSLVLLLLALVGGALHAPAAPARVRQGEARKSGPLVLYPACPCYHAVGEGIGDTRIEARLNVPPAQRIGLRLAVELTDANGKQIQTATAEAATGDTAGLNLRVPIQAPAKFIITARLLDRAGKEIAKATTDVHVRPHAESRVQVGPDGFLRVSGQPQFPIGLYSAGHYEEMAKAGFSATHNYPISGGEADEAVNPTDMHLKDLLDNSWANGMRMMVELPRKAIEKARWDQVRRRIQTFRHHPGLLCWGSEERVARGTTKLTNIVTLYHLVRELDPDHPLVLGDTKDVIKKLQKDRRDFFPEASMDVGIWWWYPFPLKEPDGNGLEGGQRVPGQLEPPSWLTTTLCKKPLWIAIQAYQKPSKGAPFPTPEEYRCQAYLSIIYGVKGLFFYTGSGQKDYEGKPSGVLNKPAEAHWDYVQKLVRELREFSPVIMAPSTSTRPTMSPADAPVEFATRELEGRLFLLTANRSNRAQSVRFSTSALSGKRAQVLYETCPAPIEGNSLAANFPPFGVHVYRIE